MGKGKKTNIDFTIILFLTDKSKVNQEYEMIYWQRKTLTKKDKIELSENKIIISGHRENSDIFYNLEKKEFMTLYSSTLYKNIIKTICNYVILSKRLLFIDKISISYNQFSLEYGSEEIYLFSKNDKIVDMPKLDNVDTSFLFSNDEKSKRFFNSFLYFIQALNEKESYYKFERLYRALNVLMNYQGNTIKDADALVAIKNLCSKNKEKFENSINYLFSPSIDIYDKLRWASFIRNKHNRKNKPIPILTTITEPYLISILLKQNENLKDEETEYMKRNKSNEPISYEKKFDEYLELILCNYIYFVRCSFFHGELNDAFFHLFKTNKLQDELCFINSFLTIFLLDCYKNFSIFRNADV